MRYNLHGGMATAPVFTVFNIYDGFRSQSHRNETRDKNSYYFDLRIALYGRRNFIAKRGRNRKSREKQNVADQQSGEGIARLDLVVDSSIAA
jgi:hypothetical protein